jgi:inner membrane protein
MPSYKKHILFSLIIAFPFFPEVYYLSLAVVGASLVDLDSHFRNRNLLIMALSGGILGLILQLLQLPPLPGIILISIALLFFVSQHRGFIHSILGIILAVLCLTMFNLSFQMLLTTFSTDYRISLWLTSMILGLMILNRKLVIPYALLVSIGILMGPITYFNLYFVFAAFFAGSLSHLVLDLFTGSGVKLFDPLSSRRYGKIVGLSIVGMWIVAVGVWFYVNFFSTLLKG